MAQRATDADIQEINPTTVNTTKFIKAASGIVDRIAALPNAPGDDVLKDIEMFLAAHLISSHPDTAQVGKASDGNASMTRLGQTGMGLDSTYFGQNAKLLDPTGLLESLGEQDLSIGMTATLTETGAFTRDTHDYPSGSDIE